MKNATNNYFTAKFSVAKYNGEDLVLRLKASEIILEMVGEGPEIQWSEGPTVVIKDQADHMIRLIKFVPDEDGVIFHRTIVRDEVPEAEYGEWNGLILADKTARKLIHDYRGYDALKERFKCSSVCPGAGIFPLPRKGKTLIYYGSTSFMITKSHATEVLLSKEWKRIERRF